jgi:4-diphosphocytidyl-2-C-methyl-D-erythritol kinase
MTPHFKKKRPMHHLTLNSPAKINLFLQILSRRADGYHELASLFQAIDLMDTLHFSLADDDRLTCTDPLLPRDDSNLILKAAALFRRKASLKFGLHVFVEKRIPQQAGLGGGSGNAATTLWALNQLLGFPVTLSDLIAWSGELGSDVAFFFSQGTAYCTGRGETIRSMPPLPIQKIWIVKPANGTSTAEVYKKLHISKIGNRDPHVALLRFYEGKPSYFNDLEETACAVLPELRAIKQQLIDAGFKTVLLSGSGSSFFCIGDQAPPQISGCAIYPTHFISRPENEWYSIKS